MIRLLSELPALPDWLTALGWSTLPSLIAGAIGAFVVIALWCQWSLCRRYRRARKMLATINKYLSGRTISFDDVRSTAGGVIGEPAHGAGAMLLGFIEHAARRGVEFQPAAALETVREREGYLKRTAFARWMMSTALVMGLAGTFVAFIQLTTGSGLVEALGALRQTPQTTQVSPELTASYDQLGTAFVRVYEGFRYAFLASLAGLGGTMLLALVNMMGVARARGRCLSAMEDFGTGVLRPLLAPPGAKTDDLTAALQSAAAVLGVSGQTIESLRETSTVLDQAARRFDQTQGANSEMVSALTKLAAEIEASRQRWDVLLDALRESRTSMGRSVEEFKKEAAAQRELSNQSVAGTVSAMREVVASMAAEVKRVSAAKTEHFATVQNDVKRMIAESKRDWEKVSESLMAKTDEGYRRSLDQVQAVIQDSRHDATASLAEMRSLLEENRQEAAAAREGMAVLVRETASAVTNHQQILAQHAGAVTASLQQWAEAPAALQAVVQAGGTSLDRLNDTLATVNEMPGHWEKRVLGSIRQLGTKLDENTAQLKTGPRYSQWWAKIQKWAAERKRGA